LRKQVPKKDNGKFMNAKTNIKPFDSTLASWLTRWRSAKRVAAMIIFAAVLATPAGLLAAEVTTDQIDYLPGTTAIIAGSGFASGETVVLQVLHADGTASTGADHDPWAVIADAEGAFTTSWHVCEDDCVGSTLQLIAAGQTSGLSAETFFTDAVFAIRLTSVVSLSSGCVPTELSSQVFLQVGHTYVFTFSLVTDGVSPDCLAFNPPFINFTFSTNFGTGPFIALPSPPPISTIYESIFVVPAAACGDTTLTFGCDTGPTRQVLGPLPSMSSVRLVATLNCTDAISCAGSQPPSITCPPNLTRSSAPGLCSAAVDYSPPSAGGVPAPVVTCVPPSGSSFPVGNTVVTCTAVNSAGATSCSFTVSVLDVESPTIACPGDTAVQTASGLCSKVVRYAVSASDNCPGVTVICTPPSETDFPKGSTTIHCTAQDTSGNAASCTFVVTVMDAERPVIDSCAPAVTVSAGANCMAAVPDVTGQVIASDNCTMADDLTISQVPPAGTLVGPGLTTVTVTVTDADGNASQCTTDFIVVSSAPLITALTGPSGPLALGSPASVTVNFTDADLNQPHTVVFGWDDGTSDAVSLGAGTGTATQTHTYAAAGVYTVSVTVSDPCASASQEFQFVVIFDPNGGFVTGGGWIQSPAGAYTADPALTGRANFGFVSMYHPGASVPTGQTEFHFEVGGLNFHSTDYQWLVVAGPLAQYKGTGTINGAGSYKFLLTARDGQASGGGGTDKFRIKIWSADAVIYDNVLGTSDDIDGANPQAIEGGSIVVQK
jgi:PKD repeat protein